VNRVVKSGILTAIQYLTLGLLLYYNDWFAMKPFLLGIQAAGMVLGLWAILEMRKSKLNITPVPLHDSVLITTGPYRLVRHPMYLSLILILYPMILPDGQLLSVVLLAAFTINLVFKLLFEERLLRERYTRYSTYQLSTWRMFPWVF
jgi:protein-S-isoprenylcysteine O-methyltransferase Ste14